MAVGYQYQNDYNEKQESKGFKKKLVILVAGLLLLVVVAIVGAPKKEIKNTQLEPNTSSSLTDKQLPVKGGYYLNDRQKNIKTNTDGFLISIYKKEDYKKFLVPLVYSAVSSKAELINELKSKNIGKCQLESIEDSSEINITTYNCVDFYVFLSTSKFNDPETDNKVINWRIMNVN